MNGSSGQLKISVLTNAEELEQTADEWSRAVEASAFDSVFATHEWFSSWTKHFVTDQSLRIVLAHDEDKLVGILPLRITNKKILGVETVLIRSLTNLHSFKYDFILDRQKGREVLKDVVAYLSARYDWDLMCLDFVSTDSETISILKSLEGGSLYRVRVVPSIESPYIPLSGTWESYLHTTGKNHRKSISQHEKKLEKQGRVELVVLDRALNPAPAVSKALAIEKSGWKGEAGTAIADSPDIAAFYHELAKSTSRKNWLALYFLSLDGREIAFDYCLNYKDRVNVLKTGYDEAYSNNSPGKVLRKKILQGMFGGRYGIYDFLGSRDEWKIKWTPEFQELTRVLVFNRKMAPSVLYHAMTSWEGFKKKVRELPPLYNILKRLRRPGHPAVNRASHEK